MDEECPAPEIYNFLRGDLVACCSEANLYETFVEVPTDRLFEISTCFHLIGTVESVMDNGHVVVSYGKRSQCTLKTEHLVKVRRLCSGDLVKLVDDIRGDGYLKVPQRYKSKAQVCGGICIVLQATSRSHAGILVTLGEDFDYVSHFHVDFVARPLEGERLTKQDPGFSDCKPAEVDVFKPLRDSMQELPDVDMWPSGTGPTYAPGDVVKVSRDLTNYLPWLAHQNSSRPTNERKHFMEGWASLLKPGKVIAMNCEGDAIVEFTDGHAWCIRPTFLEIMKKPSRTTITPGENSSTSYSPEVFSGGTCSDGKLPKQLDLFLSSFEEHQKLERVSDLCEENLFAACYGGRKELIDHMLEQNVGVECEDANGNKPIHYATHGNQPEILQFLLDKGANINATNKRHHTSLQFAVKEGFLNCVRELTKHEMTLNANIQDNEGNTALHVAITRMNTDIVNELMKLSEVNFALKNNSGLNILHVAAWRGNAVVVEKIVSEHNGLVNVQQENQGYAALHFAAISGHYQVVEILLNQKCTVDLLNKNEETALLLAAREQHWGIVELLVLHGADINKRDQCGNTVLHFCLTKVDDQTAKQLGRPFTSAIKDVEKNISNLNYTGINGILLMSCFLVQNGATIRSRNREGITPIYIASKLKEPALKLLMFFSEEIGDADSSKCKKCNKEPVNTVFTPCGHWLYCDYCCWLMQHCLSCGVLIIAKFKTDGRDSGCEMHPYHWIRTPLLLPALDARTTSINKNKDTKGIPSTEPKIGPEIYTMKKKPRGKCIIINNAKFTNPHDERHGSNKDVESMKKLFSEIHFDVQVEIDLSAERMVRVLSCAAQEKDQENADCLVVILMSHGDTGIIYGIDWKRVDLVKDVYSLFNHKNCPALKGKPKVFLIQACRGDKSNIGIDHAPDPAAAAARSSELIPEWSDMFCAYATVPEYQAMRDLRNGSWFFMNIDYVFKNYAATTDLEGLMRQVAAKATQRCVAKMIQTPSTETYGWQKKLYFNPGYWV